MRVAGVSLCVYYICCGHVCLCHVNQFGFYYSGVWRKVVFFFSLVPCFWRLHCVWLCVVCVCVFHSYVAFSVARIYFTLNNLQMRSIVNLYIAYMTGIFFLLLLLRLLLLLLLPVRVDRTARQRSSCPWGRFGVPSIHLHSGIRIFWATLWQSEHNHGRAPRAKYACLII